MQPMREADNLTTFMYRYLEIWSLNLLEPLGPVHVYKGFVLPFPDQTLDLSSSLIAQVPNPYKKLGNAKV
jgi:hypothetical protein